MRSNTTAVLDVLSSALPAHHVDDPATPPNFSVYEGETALRGSRPLYRVYTDCVHVFTSSSLVRAVAVVIGFLDGTLPPVEQSSNVLELDAVAVVAPQAAVLAPWSYRYKMPAAEVGLRRQGMRMLERMSVLVDADTQELIVPAPRLGVEDASPTDEQAAASIRGEMTPAGRLPLKGWLFVGTGEATRVPRAEAVARGMAVAYRRQGATANLEPLAALVAGLEHFAAASTEVISQAARHMLDGHAPV